MFVERDGRATVMEGDMANGLLGAGILDDTVDGSAVRTETLRGAGRSRVIRS